MVLIMLLEGGYLALLVVAFVDFLADITGRCPGSGGMRSDRPAARSPDASGVAVRKAASNA